MGLTNAAGTIYNIPGIVGPYVAKAIAHEVHAQYHILLCMGTNTHSHTHTGCFTYMCPSPAF